MALPTTKQLVDRFTELLQKNPDEIVPGSTESRDEMQETGWFPIFRTGKYPQGNFAKKDVEEMAAEFAESGRRPPIVFDHLTSEDFADNAKPGPALGYVIDLKAAPSADPRYKGETELLCRAKVGWMARYATREGAARNVSVGIYKFKSMADGVKKFAIHHLALLGAAPPGVNGLPEVVFGEESTSAKGDEVLFFSLEGGGSAFSNAPTATQPVPKESKVDPITFSEHTAKLAQFKAELDLEHSKVVTGLEAQVASFKEKAETAAADAEAVKAETTVKVEEAKQAGKVEGIAEGETIAERRFNETRLKDGLKSFAEGLRRSGKITEQELTGEGAGGVSLADSLFSLPEAARERMKALLSGRSGVEADLGDRFREELPPASGTETDIQKASRHADEATKLYREQPAKFASFRDALSHVMANDPKNKKGGA